MWLIESVTGGSPYNLVFTAFIERGQLDPGTFRAAVAATVARHEGLRVVFADGDTGPEPVVLAEHAPEITCFEHDGPAAGFEEHVRAVTAAQCRRPFDLAAAPPVRFLYFAHPSGRQAVVLTAHHMVLDGWSVGLILTEIFARYGELEGGAAAGGAAGVPLRALTRHQDKLRAGGAWDRQAGFWREHLDGVPAVLDLPADPEAAASSGRGRDPDPARPGPGRQRGRR